MRSSRRSPTWASAVSPDSALDLAVQNAIGAGITFAVAAGNSNDNACSHSPARVSGAITVGATTNTDNRSSFSSYGPCLDVFAPGSNITSAWLSSDSGTNTISGTSMASPHVAGAAALYLSNHATATPTQVRDAIVANATPAKVINAGTGSPNRLLNTIGTPPSPPPPASLLINPGFENGTTGWTSSPSGLVYANKPHSGAWGVWGAGYNAANETIGQSVRVPTNGMLSYWWHLTSGEGTSIAFDYMRVHADLTSRAWA
jgi:subtilisin family serine protease